MLKTYLKFPYIVTIPLLWAGFVLAAFFRGTDSPSYAPAVICLCALGSVLLVQGIKGRWQFPKAPVIIFLILYWAYIALSVTWSTVPYISLLFLFVFSALPFLFFAFILSKNPIENTRYHFYAMMAALAVLALWAVIQFCFFFDLYGPRIHHPLLSPNNFAVLINMGLFPALAFFIQAKDRRHIILYAALFMLFFSALFVTQSRGALLSALVSFFVMIVVLARPFDHHKIKKYLLCFIILGVAGGLFAMQQMNVGKFWLGYAFYSVTDRFALWETTWRMIQDHLWLGVGLAAFYYYYSAYRLPVDHSDGYFAHMDPLQFWAEMGVMAPLLFYAVLVAILMRTIRALRIADPGSVEQAGIIGCFTGMLAVALHTHIDFHLYLLVTLVPLSVLLAYWYVLTEKLLNENRAVLKSSRGRKTIMIAFIVLIGVSVSWIARVGVGVPYLTQAEQAAVKGNADEMRTALDKASLWMPASSFHVPQYEARWRITMLYQDQDDLSMTEKKTLFDDAMAWSDRAIDLNRNYATLRNDRGKLYFFAEQAGLLSDGYDRSIEELNIALKNDPILLDARIGLSNIYRKKGELKKALTVLEQGLGWPRPGGQRDINFLVTTARMRLALGDKEGHDKLLQEASHRAKAYARIEAKKKKARQSVSE